MKDGTHSALENFVGSEHFLDGFNDLVRGSRLGKVGVEPCPLLLQLVCREAARNP